MDLTPDADQNALREATVDWLEAHLPLEAARRREPGAIWNGMTEMGWLAMTGPEMALDHATEALVFAELGRFLAPVAAIATAVANRWTGPVAKAALAVPGDAALRLFDPDGAATALGLFNGETGLVDVPADAKGAEGLDPLTPLARVAPSTPTRIGDRRAALHLQLLAAAYALGAADAARDMAAGYARVREQFERPIGWFQGVKHPCADMAVRCAAARSQLYYAACALDAEAADAAFHVAAAKRLADGAALENGRMNIQIHGGIGMTDEAAAHLPLKRAHLLAFVAPASHSALLTAA
jgi:alkylation response protein AidB-like acyl-CoA dehydrogenase